MPALHVFNTLLVIFTLFYAIYISWQLGAWLMMPVNKPSSASFKTNVSIIIPARNEAANIGACIESVLKQNYPSGLLEIIVADDQSEDNTKQIAEQALGNGQSKWQYVYVKESPSNKKKAIEAGLAISSGELIIVTDADCIAGEEWVASTVSAYEEHGYMMLCGPVALTGEKNFCEKFQSLEVAGLSLLAGAGIKSGKPLLCNGANIAYTREAFNAVGGFNGIDNLPTGDDTLLMLKIHKHFPGRLGFLKTPEALVYTHAQPNWKTCFMQRIRWASKSFRSKSSANSLVSLLVFITNFLLFVGIATSLVYISSSLTFIACLIIKFTVDFLLLTCAADFYKKTNLLVNFLAAEFVTIAYISWTGIAANYLHYSWKGRNY